MSEKKRFEMLVKTPFKERIRRRIKSLEARGYSYLGTFHDDRTTDRVTGDELSSLFDRELGRKEYVILPGDENGNTHMIYGRNI